MTPHSRNREAAADVLFHLLFLAGLPIALWRLTGNPIPTRLPSWDDIQTWWASVQLAPAQALDIVPRLVVDALWIAWAWYAAWFTLGLLWELLHLPGVLLPRMMLRLTPRTTVQAITAGAVAATPAAHAAPAQQHATAAPLPADLTGRLHLSLAPATSAPPRLGFPLNVIFHPALNGAPVHEVVHGDTLWDLAVHYYGDGEQWRRIYAANAGRPQPDGQHLVKPELILPGWKLTIPHRTTPNTATTDPPPATSGPTTTTRPPTTPTPGETRAPAAPGPGAATPGPTTPTPPRPDAPAAPRTTDRPTPTPAPDPHTPHTVGWHMPDGGYIGITLIAAIAVSTALLATRRRLHPDTTAPIPETAEHLTRVYDAAKRTRALGRTPADHQGQIPPLFKPQPGVPMLGTYPRADEEAWYDPGLNNGPLAFTGPGAEDTVRALALSMLGASDLEQDLAPDISPLGLKVVLIDHALAEELLDAHPHQHLPGWLQLTDTPAAAVAAFHGAARRRAEAGLDAEEFPLWDEEPLTMLIARTDPQLHQIVVEACLTDPTAGLGAILLGDPPQDPNTTTVTLGQDGTAGDVTGPRSREIYGLSLYRTPRDLARDLFRVLHAAREVYRQPLAEPGPLTVIPTPAPPAEAEPDAATDPVTQAEPAAGAQDTDFHASTELTAADPRTLTGTPLLVRVLGPVDVLGPQPPGVPARGDRTRAILTLLALRPAGVSAAELVELAWPRHGRSDRIPMDAVYEAQRRVRTLLAAAADPAPTSTNQTRENTRSYLLLDNATGRYRLDPDQITTDLDLRARLEDRAERANAADQRLHLLQQAAALYRGPLADALDDDGRDWLTIARYEHLLHTAHLHLRIAELTVDTDPGTALDHVKQAAALAPDDEHTGTEAVRLYQQLGRDDLARALTWRRAE